MSPRTVRAAPPGASFGIGIDGVAQAIPEEIKTQYGNNDKAGGDQKPLVVIERRQAATVLKQNAPTRHGGPNAEVQE